MSEPVPIPPAVPPVAEFEQPAESKDILIPAEDDDHPDSPQVTETKVAEAKVSRAVDARWEPALILHRHNVQRTWQALFEELRDVAAPYSADPLRIYIMGTKARGKSLVSRMYSLIFSSSPTTTMGIDQISPNNGFDRIPISGINVTIYDTQRTPQTMKQPDVVQKVVPYLKGEFGKNSVEPLNWANILSVEEGKRVGVEDCLADALMVVLSHDDITEPSHAAGSLLQDLIHRLLESKNSQKYTQIRSTVMVTYLDHLVRSPKDLYVPTSSSSAAAAASDPSSSSSKIASKMAQLANLLQVDPRSVFPIWRYETGKARNLFIECLMLTALLDAVKNAARRRRYKAAAAVAATAGATGAAAR